MGSLIRPGGTWSNPVPRGAIYESKASEGLTGITLTRASNVIGTGFEGLRDSSGFGSARFPSLVSAKQSPKSGLVSPRAFISSFFSQPYPLVNPLDGRLGGGPHDGIAERSGICS